MKHYQHLLRAALPFLAAVALPASSLVNGFNVVTLGNFSTSNTDLEGTLAVGGAASISNYALNQYAPMPNTAGGGYDTVVAGNLNFAGGSAYGTIHAGSATYTNVGSLCSTCSVVGGSSPVDFGALASSVKSLNSFLYQFSPTGVASQPYSNLTLSGSNSSSLEVFSITAAQLSGNTGIDITNVSSAATILINVIDTGSHTATTSGGGLSINGTGIQTAGHVLFNFANSITGVTIQNSFYASVLAPNAALSGNYGAFNGDLVAASYDGHNQFNLDPFTGTLPVTTPEPGSATLCGMAGLLLLSLGSINGRRKALLARAAPLGK